MMNMAYAHIPLNVSNYTYLIDLFMPFASRSKLFVCFGSKRRDFVRTCFLCGHNRSFPGVREPAATFERRSAEMGDTEYVPEGRDDKDAHTLTQTHSDTPLSQSRTFSLYVSRQGAFNRELASILGAK